MKLEWYLNLKKPQWSLPSRGAWIEIACLLVVRETMLVAPLTGSVD